MATKSGNAYLRVYAQTCRGLSHITSGRFTSAIDDLSDALNFARSRKAGLENEPRILADLANARRLNGEDVSALVVVDEAIEIATKRHARVPECLARFVRAKLLLQAADRAKNIEGSRELERAKALMDETGAMIFETFFEATDMDKSQISTKAG